MRGDNHVEEMIRKVAAVVTRLQAAQLRRLEDVEELDANLMLFRLPNG
jgi:hypothetical protein